MWWSLLLIIYLKYGEFSAKFHEEVVEIFRSRVVSPTFVACINFMLTLKTVLSSSILWWFYTKTFYCENIEEKFQSILALKSLFHLRIILFFSQKLALTMVFTSQELILLTLISHKKWIPLFEMKACLPFCVLTIAIITWTLDLASSLPRCGKRKIVLLACKLPKQCISKHIFSYIHVII